jgi:hypothetical protein
MSSYHRFEELRLKLIDGESVNVGEITGDSVAKMLREIEDMGNFQNPYCVTTIEV